MQVFEGMQMCVLSYVGGAAWSYRPAEWPRGRQFPSGEQGVN